MKKKIKTYGVKGLMEWVCNVPVGKTHMRVEFTGGVLTPYGNTPAKYTTSDPLKQAVIENSPLYKSGRIKLLRSRDTDEEYVIGGEEAVSDNSEGVAEQPTSDASTNEDNTPSSSSVIQVDNIDAAREYLIAHYELSRGKLRYKKNILDAAAEQGIEFKFTEEG